jgi:hypothetical protein
MVTYKKIEDTNVLLFDYIPVAWERFLTERVPVLVTARRNLGTFSRKAFLNLVWVITPLFWGVFRNFFFSKVALPKTF